MHPLDKFVTPKSAPTYFASWSSLNIFLCMCKMHASLCVTSLRFPKVSAHVRTRSGWPHRLFFAKVFDKDDRFNDGELERDFHVQPLCAHLHIVSSFMPPTVAFLLFTLINNIHSRCDNIQTKVNKHCQDYSYHKQHCLRCKTLSRCSACV